MAPNCLPSTVAVRHLFPTPAYSQIPYLHAPGMRCAVPFDKLDISIKFKENLEVYKRMGLNPMSLATRSAVKVDLLETVYPALDRLRGELERRRG